ncbi:hypothetical protein A147_16830 [Vibrio splendidus FF-6]|nr:hypothetical protein A147_16830 [Vibrio splendidus FF-6]
MGQVVQGSSKEGFSIAVKQYESIKSEAYIPAAKDMLNDLQDDFERLQRVVNARTHKLESKLESEAC